MLDSAHIQIKELPEAQSTDDVIVFEINKLEVSFKIDDIEVQQWLEDLVAVDGRHTCTCRKALEIALVFGTRI